jgi:hypothetical protein
MSDKDEADLWNQMDEGFRAAVRATVEQGENDGAHGRVERAELERHLHEDHRIIAETRLTTDPVGDGRVRIGEEVVQLDALCEARLRAGHWRAHELGVGHRQ